MAAVAALDVGGVDPDAGEGGAPDRPLSCRSATASSSDSHILYTWKAPMRSMPGDAATRPTFLADTPVGTISGTVDITALSTRE